MEATTVGERLRLARRRAALTQQEAAKRIGVSKVTVGQWERGTTDWPQPANLQLAAAAYGVSVHELVRGTPAQPQPPLRKSPPSRPVVAHELELLKAELATTRVRVDQLEDVFRLRRITENARLAEAETELQALIEEQLS